MTPITGYAVYDKVTDSVVITKHGILFEKSQISSVKLSVSSDYGITNNAIYHIKNTLGVDLEKICDDYMRSCETPQNQLLHLRLMVESLRKGKNITYWAYKDQYLEWISKYHSVEELMKVAKEAARKSWTDISRYIIIERTLN